MNEIEHTRNRLIAAARHLFAQSGYRGASVRQITEEAGANLGAISYHFGSKDGLYQATLSSLIDPLIQRVTAAATEGTSPLDRIEGIMRAISDHMLSSADVPCIMMHQMTMAGPLPEPSRRAQLEVRRLLEAQVVEGQRDGSIRPGPPHLLVLSIVAQPMYFGMAGRPLAEIHGMDLRDPDTREEFVSHAIAFARAGLAASGTRNELRKP